MYGQDSLSTIMGIVCSVFDAYSSVLFLPESEDRYILASHFSLGDNIVPGIGISSGQGLVGWILRNQKPLLVNNFDRNTGCLGYYSAGGDSKIKAFMGCPMSSGQGALCLDSKKTYSFSEKDQKILHQFTHLIASVQSDKSSISHTAQEKEYYETLSAIHVLRGKHPRWSDFLGRFLDILSRSTGFELCFLAVRDEWGKEYALDGWNREIFADGGNRSFSMSSGLIGWVFKNNTPVFSGEKGTGPADISVFGKEMDCLTCKSVICLPLNVNKKTRGVLVLADRRALHIPDDLKLFLFIVSDYLAKFL
ncbi:MAG: GAF domain-containing protein, partial [Desulfovibrionales bacterium]